MTEAFETLGTGAAGGKPRRRPAGRTVAAGRAGAAGGPDAAREALQRAFCAYAELCLVPGALRLLVAEDDSGDEANTLRLVEAHLQRHLDLLEHAMTDAHGAVVTMRTLHGAA